jgi:hypothetical protein
MRRSAQGRGYREDTKVIAVAVQVCVFGRGVSSGIPEAKRSD